MMGEHLLLGHSGNLDEVGMNEYMTMDEKSR